MLRSISTAKSAFGVMINTYLRRSPYPIAIIPFSSQYSLVTIPIIQRPSFSTSPSHDFNNTLSDGLTAVHWQVEALRVIMSRKCAWE